MERYKKIISILELKSKKVREYEDQDSVLLSVIEVEQAIKNYCHIPHVPKEADFVWANIVTDVMLFIIETNTDPDEGEGGNIPVDIADVSSVRVGDTTVAFGDKYRSNARTRTLQSHELNLDGFLYNYTMQLHRFRKVI